MAQGLCITYISLLLVSATCALALAWAAWLRRAQSGVLPLMWLCAFSALLAVSSAMESLWPTVAGKEAWVNVEYFAYSAGPVLYLLTTQQYLGNQTWTSSRRAAMLMILPTLTIVFGWTNGWHHLMRENLHAEPVGFLSFLGKTVGPWWWIHSIYSLALMVTSIWALSLAYWRSPRPHRGRILYLLLGLLIPVLSTVLYVSGVESFHDLDPTPAVIPLTTVLIYLGLTRRQLFDITPIAYAQVIEGMTDGTLVLDRRLEVLHMNSACARIFSMAHRPALGQRVAVAFASYPEIVAFLTGEEANGRMEYALSAQPTDRHLELRLSPLCNKRGIPVGRVVLIQDITQRKAAEAALRVRDAAIESALTGFAVADLSGRLIHMNPAGDQIWRSTPNGLVGRRFADLFDPADEADAVIGALNDTGYWRGELSGRLDDGALAPIEVAASLVKDEHSKPMCIQASLTDITERRQAHEAIARSLDYYLQLFDGFPALVWRTDVEGSLDYVNKTWLDFTGRTLQQEVGEGWTECVHPDDLPACMETYLSAFAARRPFDMEYRIRRADGEYRWISDYGRPLHGPGGEFTGYIGSCYDVTVRREQAEQLDHLASHDPLTGLPNRRVLRSALIRLITRARRGPQSALLFVDLDRFKAINDTLGHYAGDQALVHVTQAIHQTLRNEDLLVRLGGDEFAILLEGIPVDLALAVAERVRASVDDDACPLGTGTGRLSLSIGVTAIDESDAPTDVVARADIAMYRAKQTGRNRVVMYDDSMAQDPICSSAPRHRAI